MAASSHHLWLLSAPSWRTVVREAALSVPRPPELALDMASTLAPVAIDPRQFRQLVVNLVLNAVQASQSVGGSIEVLLTSDEHDLLLTVEDRGQGLAPDVLARLFDHDCAPPCGQRPPWRPRHAVSVERDTLLCERSEI